MPRRDGTGPMGAGSMTGRGLGACTGASAVKRGSGSERGLGLGFAYGRGFGRGYGKGIAASRLPFQTSKELLEGQRDILKSRLDVIDKQLENM